VVVELDKLRLAARKVLRSVAGEREIVGNVVEQVSAIDNEALDALSLTWQSVERGGGKETLPEKTVARITTKLIEIKLEAEKLRETIGERLLKWLSAEENLGVPVEKWWRDLDFKMTPWVDIETSGLGEALYLQGKADFPIYMSDSKLKALQGVVKKYREVHQRLGFNIVNALNNLAEPIENRRFSVARRNDAEAAARRVDERLDKIDKKALARFGLKEKKEEEEEPVLKHSPFGFDKQWPHFNSP